MKGKLKYKMLNIANKFDVANYLNLVDVLCEGFFFLGNYSPARGRINAIRHFYNICVLDDIDDLEHDIQDDIEIDKLLLNEEFMKEFGAEISDINKSNDLTFGMAYHDALEMVNTKKSSLGQITDAILSIVSDFTDKITDTLSEESLQKMEKIAEDIKNGKISEDAITEAVGKKHFS